MSMINGCFSFQLFIFSYKDSDNLNPIFDFVYLIKRTGKKCTANGMANSMGNSMGNGTSPYYLPHYLPYFCHTFPALFSTLLRHYLPHYSHTISALYFSARVAHNSQKREITHTRRYSVPSGTPNTTHS